MSREHESYYILSKSKTIKFGKTHFIWEGHKGRNYTQYLSEAGIFTFKELEGKIKPFSSYEVNTKSIAIPVWLVNEIFSNETIYTEDIIKQINAHYIYLVGSIDWNLSGSILS